VPERTLAAMHLTTEDADRHRTAADIAATVPERKHVMQRLSEALEGVERSLCLLAVALIAALQQRGQCVPFLVREWTAVIVLGLQRHDVARPGLRVRCGAHQGPPAPGAPSVHPARPWPRAAVCRAPLGLCARRAGCSPSRRGRRRARYRPRGRSPTSNRSAVGAGRYADAREADPVWRGARPRRR